LFPPYNTIQYIINKVIKCPNTHWQRKDMQQQKTKKLIDPMLSFHLMKFAYQDYQKDIGNLTKHEYSKAYKHANEEMLLHQIILSSKEACYVVIPEPLLHQTLRDVIAEYPNEKQFHAILQEYNIPIADYIIALHNDLRVESILARVACNVQPVRQIEMLDYFNNNKEDFYSEGKASFRKSSPAIFAILLKKKQLNACRLWLRELVQQPN